MQTITRPEEQSQVITYLMLLIKENELGGAKKERNQYDKFS